MPRIAQHIRRAVAPARGGGTLAAGDRHAGIQAPYRSFENWELVYRSPIRRLRPTPSRDSTASEAAQRCWPACGYVDQGHKGPWHRHDFRRRIIHASEGFPLDGALTAGFGTQLASGAYDAFFVPWAFHWAGASTSKLKDQLRSYFQPIIVPTFYPRPCPARRFGTRPRRGYQVWRAAGPPGIGRYRRHRRRRHWPRIRALSDVSVVRQGPGRMTAAGPLSFPCVAD